VLRDELDAYWSTMPRADSDFMAAARQTLQAREAIPYGMAGTPGKPRCNLIPLMSQLHDGSQNHLVLDPRPAHALRLVTLAHRGRCSELPRSPLSAIQLVPTIVHWQVLDAIPPLFTRGSGRSAS